MVWGPSSEVKALGAQSVGPMGYDEGFQGSGLGFRVSAFSFQPQVSTSGFRGPRQKAAGCSTGFI